MSLKKIDSTHRPNNMSFKQKWILKTDAVKSNKLFLPQGYCKIPYIWIQKLFNY